MCNGNITSAVLAPSAGGLVLASCQSLRERELVVQLWERYYQVLAAYGWRNPVGSGGVARTLGDAGLVVPVRTDVKDGGGSRCGLGANRLGMSGVSGQSQQGAGSESNFTHGGNQSICLGEWKDFDWHVPHDSGDSFAETPGSTTLRLEPVEETSLADGQSLNVNGVDGASATVGGSSNIGNEEKGSESTTSSGPNVSVESVNSSNRERNRRWRAERKERKQARQASGQDWRKGISSRKCDRSEDLSAKGWKVVDVELQESIKKKWIAKNKLQTLEAERRLAVLEGNSVDDEIRRYRTRVHAATEQNMVRIEKTHGQLRASGNVKGEYAASDAAKRDVFHGSAETVLTPDLTSGSISPDSSASQAEFRAAQKKILDLEAEKKTQEAYVKRCKDALAKVGLRVESVEAFDKQTFTDDTAGNDLIDDLYGDTGVCIHRVQRDGKTKIKLGAGEEFDLY